MRKKFTHVKKYTILLYLILISGIANAQLIVNADVTDETCPGYGALALSVSNADPSAPVVYKVYLMPEETIPVWNSTESNVPALGDGDYLIIATQQVNGNTITGQVNATINSLYVPVEFYINNTVSACSANSDMTITVTAGAPSTYEIVNGPITVSPQSSNVFSNLPSGSYEIRVTDACGSGYIGTYSFFTEQTVLTLQGPDFPDAVLPACNTITATYNVTSQSSAGIAYPLAVQITVTAPNGSGTQQYTQNITSGNTSALTINQQIAHYNLPYTVSISVTDPCGTAYTDTETVNQVMSASASSTTIRCGEQTLSVGASKFVPPFNIAFTSVPAGFDPSAFSNSYPGPYTTTAVFGNENNPIPVGSYSGTVTDACGNTANFSRQVAIAQPPVPNVNTNNNNCQTQLGRIIIGNPEFPLVTASVTSAPSAYGQDLPYNVNASINDEGRLRMHGMPPGTYTFNLTDSCGNSYTDVAAVVPQFTPAPPDHTLRPDCTPGMGCVMIESDITAVTITSAPSGFTQPLPYNASGNIVNNVFYMDGLAAGNYTFTIDSSCESGYTEQIEILPLSVSAESAAVSVDCEDFEIMVTHNSNAEEFTTFWLQRFNPDTDAWENPADGTAYNENDEITSANALPITVGQTMNGLNYTGEFRIIKQQGSLASGSTGNTEKFCAETIREFEFYNELSVTGIYNQTCVGESFDIQINTTGVSPVFELISKDGDTSFYVNNGTNNVFSGLESALYLLKVTDACGEYRVEQFNVAELPPLITASTAENLAFCSEAGTSGSFDLSQQDEAVLGDVDSDIAVVTYHLSQQDADQGINPLPSQYTSGPATIYARVEWIVNPLCYGTSSFELIPGEPFELAMNDTWGLCGSDPVTITADPGYVSYVWSGGETTESITVTEPGEYTVTVTNEGGCETTKTVSAIIISQPLITEVDVRDWTDNDNSINVMIDQSDITGYEFSLDGINYQESPEFTDVPAGLYTVYVRDRFGCNPPNEKEVIMATYPKFFSPNGDGHNDTWRIAFATMEPGLTVQIFNRYGKVLSTFSATSPGWDGTFDGAALPADDYWFVIKRNNGKEYRGHFSMLR